MAKYRVTPSGVADSDSKVSGYSIVEADSKEIVNLFKNYPHLQREGSSIDILEMLTMPGM
jgi:hypothetical protein